MSRATALQISIEGAQRPLRARQLLGKYRIMRLLGSGGFAKVYAAVDTIEGTQVALKIPHAQYLDDDMLQLFKKEVRLVAGLDHPSILAIKDASVIDGRFVVVSRMGLESLDERLKRRMAAVRALNLIEQMIDALAYAHESGIIHCDIKPDNFILFDGNRIRLADFGIAKVANQTVYGSGTGTVGRMAPEQAMGRPTKRSDVFSMGLIMFRMLAGRWPEYPFQWPPPGAINLRKRRVHPDMIAIIKKAIEVQPRMRYTDGVSLLREFKRVLPRTLRRMQRAR